MMEHIRKRDGRLEKFDLTKISYAIFKAFRATGKPNRKIAEEIAEKVFEKSPFDNIPDVEYIQDAVEKTLFEEKHFDVVKTYILYRDQHQKLRNAKDLFSNLDIIDDYINLKDWRIKESANSSYSL